MYYVDTYKIGKNILAIFLKADVINDFVLSMQLHATLLHCNKKNSEYNF